MNQMYGYIYKSTNILNNKIYIGQHLANTFEPDRYIGSGTLFKRAIKKYGKENFKCELLEECESQDELDNREIYWIAYFDSTNLELGYNITEGGSGGSGPSSEHKKQLLREYTSNTILINDGNICIRIPLSQLEEYLNLGFKRGCLPYTRSEEFKKSVSKTLSGMVAIHKNDIRTRVNKDILDSYLQDGWQLGWVDANKKVGYKKHKGFGNRHLINNGVKNLCVYESEIPYYQASGWKIGGLKHSDEWNRKISDSNKLTKANKNKN